MAQPAWVAMTGLAAARTASALRQRDPGGGAAGRQRHGLLPDGAAVGDQRHVLVGAVRRGGAAVLLDERLERAERHFVLGREAHQGGALRDPHVAERTGVAQCGQRDAGGVIGGDLPAGGARHGDLHRRAEPAEDGLAVRVHLGHPEAEPVAALRDAEAQREGEHGQRVRAEDQAGEPAVGRRHEALGQALGLEVGPRRRGQVRQAGGQRLDGHGGAAGGDGRALG